MKKQKLEKAAETFRSTGICPLNENALSEEDFVTNQSEDQDIVEDEISTIAFDVDQGPPETLNIQPDLAVQPEP